MTGLRSMPVLSVADVRRAAEFYRDSLGFGIAGMWPGDPAEPANFAIVELGRVTIALDVRGGGAAPRQAWVAYIYVEDVDGYHRALLERGVTVERPPEDAFYGCRDMDVRDADGNLLGFGQDLNPGPKGPGL